ncbi:MAG: hypothetical protein ACTS4W_00410 [Candidatus Hodgkinia cicadicola]
MVLIRKIINEGIMIYACLTFPRLNDTYDLYQHGKIFHFIFKNVYLTLSLLTHVPTVCFQVNSKCSQHLMCYVICNSNVNLTLIKSA